MLKVAMQKAHHILLDLDLGALLRINQQSQLLNQAKCDGPSALPLSALEGFVSQMKALDDLVKSFPELDTSI